MTNTTGPSKRIIKINQCPTLSNNSTLTYHIGCDDGSDSNQTIHFRIFSNTGGGFFNDEWIALADIQQAFDKWPVDSPLTSFALNDLFTGKSANSPAFIMAILKEESIVVTLKGKHRSHEYQGSEEFVVEMNKLIADGIDLKVDTDKKSSKVVKDNASANKKSPRSTKPQLKSA
ncbi:MAG: hypothetical protein COA83_09530 [Methylophaga sp.]|nr:MAG: hypothetical protein COA83_09530 [Methylophaga sp.]